MRLTSIVRKAKEVLKTEELYVLPVASGGAPYREETLKSIRFIRHGCANRPFYHIAVQEITEEQYGNVIEQVGSYDPLPNKNNEKLVALNLSRIQHWLNKGAIVSLPLKKLLGLSGYFPIHPQSYRDAWLKRKLLIKELAALEAAAAKSTASLTTETSGNSGNGNNGDPPKEPTSES